MNRDRFCFHLRMTRNSLLLTIVDVIHKLWKAQEAHLGFLAFSRQVPESPHRRIGDQSIQLIENEENLKLGSCDSSFSTNVTPCSL
jgi:hypothetical protein